MKIMGNFNRLSISEFNLKTILTSDIARLIFMVVVMAVSLYIIQFINFGY
jgi:hypothetical protein